MLLIWGVKHKNHGTFQIEKGRTIDSKDSALLVGFNQSYFHLYFIPLIPFGISPKVVNLTTGQEIKDAEMSDQLKDVLKGLKEDMKTPWWMFAGLIMAGTIIATLAILPFIMSVLNKF